MSTYYNSTHNRYVTARKVMSARDWDIARGLRQDGVSTYEIALAFGITRAHLLNWTEPKR